jgi:methionyl-tRNA formyltransferase
LGQKDLFMDASKSLRILYMGTPDFAVMPLQTLVEAGYNVVAVVTTPDKPAGRGLALHESAVKRYAAGVGLPVLQPEKLRAPEFLEQLRTLAPDLGIVIAFRMLPEAVWALPKRGTFNLHASLLPQYRGAAPINRAIMNGEPETGVTTFLLNAEIDKGAILGRRKVAIAPDDTAGTLHDKLRVAGTELVLDTVERIAAGTARPVEQTEPDNELKGAPKLFKEDCRVDWHAPTGAIRNHIRGLSPYPAAWSELTTDNTPPIGVKIFSARSLPRAATLAPGTIVSDGRTSLHVACADGLIAIEELQLAGKKRMPTADFLRGFPEIAKYRFE